MQAIVYDRYGSPDQVLHLLEIDKPAIEDDEILVRVRAASVNPYDWHLVTGKPYLSRLKYGLRTAPGSGVGADLAGQIEAVGDGVAELRPGDDVFGQVNGEEPGLPNLELGSLAEYVAVSQQWVAPKPVGLSYEEAAAVPLAAITALQGLRDYGRVQPGHRVLINGASGGVGTFAVQIAKAFGAEVTAVCSTRNVEMVRSIGADHVIDYTHEDFTKSGRHYDLLLDNVGNRSPAECRRVLAPRGTYLASFGQPDNNWLGPLGKLLRMKVMSLFVGQRMVLLTQHRSKDDIAVIRELLEAGQVRPVIDETYPLAATVDALHYLEQGHARGKVVITV